METATPKSIIFLSPSLQPSAQLKITVTLHIEYFKSFGLFFIMLIGDMWNQFSFNELWCSSIFLKKQSNLSLSFRERSYVTHWDGSLHYQSLLQNYLLFFPFSFKQNSIDKSYRKYRVARGKCNCLLWSRYMDQILEMVQHCKRRPHR